MPDLIVYQDGVERARQPFTLEAPPATTKRVVFWAPFHLVSGSDVQGTAALTDAQLDTWKARGVGGLALQSSRLYGLGGTRSKFADAEPGTGGEWEYQRALKNSDIVARLHARGMKAYIVTWTARYQQAAPGNAVPFGSWTDDAHWTNSVLPALTGIAGAIKRYGLDGLIFDTEDYPGEGGIRPNWNWSYTGNPGEPTTRAKAMQRGQQAAAALGAVKVMDLAAYFLHFPSSAKARSLCATYPATFGTDPSRVFVTSVQQDFLKGLLSDGAKYGSFRMLDDTFYKDTGLTTASFPAGYTDAQKWADAMIWGRDKLRSFTTSYGVNQLKLLWTPFTWIDNDTAVSPYNDSTKWGSARPVSYVDAQYDACRLYAEGDEFHNYTHQFASTTFPWDTYASAIRP